MSTTLCRSLFVIIVSVLSAHAAHAVGGFSLLYQLDGTMFVPESRRVTVAQLDADPAPEILTAKYAGSGLRIYDGATGAVEFAYTAGETDLATGGFMLRDVTGDGLDELIFSHGAAGSQFVLVFSIPGSYPTDAPSGRLERDSLDLEQSRPNPFRTGTTIEFTVDREQPVSLRIYSVEGRVVRTLLDDELHPAGRHEMYWDGTDESGQRVAAGQYFYQLSTEGGTRARKALHLR